LAIKFAIASTLFFAFPRKYSSLKPARLSLRFGLEPKPGKRFFGGNGVEIPLPPITGDGVTGCVVGLDFLPGEDGDGDTLFLTQPVSPPGDLYHFPFFAGADWAPDGTDITDYVSLFI
jgi:hypothetical protein